MSDELHFVNGCKEHPADVHYKSEHDDDTHIRAFAVKVNDGVPNVFDPAGMLKGQGVEHIVSLLKKNPK